MDKDKRRRERTKDERRGMRKERRREDSRL